MRRLSDLLGYNHPLFTYNIDQLERAAGRPGIDTRLFVDCTERAHQVMRKLRFEDVANVRPIELYNALVAAAKRDDDKEIFSGTDFVLLELGGEVVSFNQHDLLAETVDFDQRSLDHARRHLRMEIIKRYADHDRTDNQLVYRLTEEAGILRANDKLQAKEQANTKRSDMQDSSKPRILAIGDIFTDAFITLGDETAKIIKEGDKEWLAVPFGQKPPYEKVDIVKSVGPSPNVAVSVSRLGYQADLMAWVGGDETGEEALEHLRSENVGTDSMVVEEDKATSYWYVLCYKADRTMLVKSEQYRYEWRDPATKPDWVYLAYLGEDSWPLHEALLDYLERNPDIKFALQPGTFHFKWGTEKMAGLYRRSDMVLMNREEAMEVTGLPYDSIQNLADGLHALGPEIAVITDGPNGSYASENGRVLTIPNYPDPSPPIERTGAGDAFASTFVAAIAAGESVETALAWSPINSMNVVQHVGAQKGLLYREDIERYLAEAPDYYRVSEHKED